MMKIPINDDGMSSMADGLLWNNTLTKLDVQQCGFSVKGTVVYKVEFGHYSSPLVLVYLVKQDHFDQTMIPYFSIKTIKGNNGKAIILAFIRCSVITILDVGDDNK